MGKDVVSDGLIEFPAIEYEVSLRYGDISLTVVRAPKGTPAWAVVECARQAHMNKYCRVCSAIYVAGEMERPATWTRNPLSVYDGREAWMLVIEYELGYPGAEVCHA